MKSPASIVNTDMGEKNLAPKCYQHSEASRADTTNISSIKIHTNPLRKGEFCPFIVAHFFRSVKNRRNIYADIQNDGQER